MMQLIKYPERKSWPEILKRPVIDTSSLENSVFTILKDVKENRDSALKKYSLQFDKVELNSLEVSKEEFDFSEMKVPKKLKQAIQLAKRNIEKFHLSQKEKVKAVETVKGVKCWRKSVPIEKVGLYIPGGSAPLFSTILMLGIPAKIAGCKEIILCTPSSDATILYVAKLVGIKKVFKVGGAQAIAAMAYGT